MTDHLIQTSISFPVHNGLKEGNASTPLQHLLNFYLRIKHKTKSKIIMNDKMNDLNQVLVYIADVNLLEKKTKAQRTVPNPPTGQ
jgi:uncharacterized protein YukJ